MPRTLTVERHLFMYKNMILNDSPVAYWRMNEASGNLTDLVRQTAATKNNSPTYSQTGAILADTDTAILLDGSNASFSIV